MKHYKFCFEGAKALSIPEVVIFDANARYVITVVDSKGRIYKISKVKLLYYYVEVIDNESH